MSRFFDLDGNPISRTEWATQVDRTLERRIRLNDVGDAHVSTIWLGLDHQFGPGPPLIFETMVFGYDSRPTWKRWLMNLLDREWDEPEHQWRYSTRDQAIAGHERVLAAVRERRL